MLPIRDHERSSRFPFVTIGIIALNAWAFFQEFAAPSLEQFIERWALIPALVDFSDVASLIPFITSQFLHAGVAHILFNMWFLGIFGDNVEGHFGHVRFLAFYLFAGIVAGLAQFFFSIGSPIPMLGASGAVAGVLGAYWVLFPRHRVDTLLPFGFGAITTLPANVVLLFWFIGQLFSGIGSLGVGNYATGGVAWWAHIGGFAFGWLIARAAQRTLHHEHPPHAHSVGSIDLWK